MQPHTGCLRLADGATLVLARHGQTAWNAVGRYQGQADPPLDATGRSQAQMLARSVIARGTCPAFVVSSDLRRASQTALAFSVPGGRPVRLDPRLRELDLCGWEGLSRAEAAARFPTEFDAWTSGGVAAWSVRRGGGETAEEAGVRAGEALVELANAVPAGETGVVVSHGIVLQAALRWLGVVNPPHLDNGAYLRLARSPSDAGATIAA